MMREADALAALLLTPVGDIAARVAIRGDIADVEPSNTRISTGLVW
jgi:hypothetical protein